MATYRRPGLQAFIWSVCLAIFYNHFILSSNPFQALVLSLLLLVAVLVQLFLLRKRGLLYLGVFMICLIVFTMVLSYVDSQLFTFPKRYYGTHA